MSRSRASHGCTAVTKIPGVGQSEATGVGRASAVEGHLRALVRRVRPARIGDGRQGGRRVGRHQGAERRRQTRAVRVRDLYNAIALRRIQATVGAHSHKVTAAASGKDVGERRRSCSEVDLGDDPAVSVDVQERRAWSGRERHPIPVIEGNPDDGDGAWRS